MRISGTEQKFRCSHVSEVLGADADRKKWRLMLDDVNNGKDLVL